MEQSARNSATVPKHQGSSRWQWFFRHLVPVPKRFRREDGITVSDGSHGYDQAAPMSGSSADGGRLRLSTLFDKKLEAKLHATVNEAGRPEGRVVKALVLGEQRYPDPAGLRPKAKGPLAHDEGFQEGLSFLSRLDRERERD